MSCWPVLRNGASPGGGGRAELEAARHREAQAQPLEEGRRAALEGLGEDAGDQVEAVVGVEVGARAIGVAVHHRQRVLPPAALALAVQLQALVAVGDQVHRERALDEGVVHVGLEQLQAERRLEPARAQAHPCPRAEVDERVLEHGLAVAEVRHEAQVDEAEERPLQDGAHAAHDERVGARAVRVLQEEAPVALELSAQPEHEGLVRGRQREAFFRHPDDGALRGLGARRGGLGGLGPGVRGGEQQPRGGEEDGGGDGGHAGPPGTDSRRAECPRPRRARREAGGHVGDGNVLLSRIAGKTCCRLHLPDMGRSGSSWAACP